MLSDKRGARAEVAFADRRWLVVARPAIAPAPPAWIPDRNVFYGFLIAGLIALVVFLIRRKATDLEAQVAHKTRDLKGAITELNRQRSEAEYNAIHDDLTGLMNKRGLRNALPEFLSSGDVDVISIDLDYFKNVNDTLGHIVGDAVLVKVGQKLCARAPPGRAGYAPRRGRIHCCDQIRRRCGP